MPADDMFDIRRPVPADDSRSEPRLGPHVVGRRVVVRHLVRGETGPTGGPALSDVLGVCESWGEEKVAVRRHDGELVEIAIADIVAGKPVPPRPERRRPQDGPDQGLQDGR